MKVEYRDVPEVVGYRVEIVIPKYEVGTIAHRYPGMRISQVRALREEYRGLLLLEAVAIIDAYTESDDDPR